MSRSHGNYGVLELKVENGEFPRTWTPRNEHCTPPASLSSFPHEVTAQAVRAANASEWSRGRRRWAVVVESGGFVMVETPADQRPADPLMLPPTAKIGINFHHAKSIVGEKNASILRAALVPRVWYVVVVALHPDQQEQPATQREGGDADVA